MDALNAGLYTLLTSDSQHAALAPGGAWDMRADEGTPLPLTKFRLVIENYDYVFQGLSCIRFVYRITGHAQDTPTKTAKELASTLKGHIFRIINEGTLTVTGYNVILCRAMSGIPPMDESKGTSADTFSEGILAEIILAPA